MTLYMRDNYEHFGNHVSIDVMRSYICNTNFFFYIDPVVLNEIRKINIVSEEFIITENHNAYTFI